MSGCQPDLVLPIGGVNDFSAGRTASEIIAAMEEFEAELSALGVPVRWVLEPTWGFSTAYAPIHDYLLANKPDAIDCRWEAGKSGDGIHPFEYRWFAMCIEGALAE